MPLHGVVFDMKARPQYRQILAWMITAVYSLILITMTHLPPHTRVVRNTISLAGSDTMAHVVAYLVLAVLVFGLCQVGRGLGKGMVILLGLTVWAALDELTQPYIGRTADVHDWGANLVGLSLGFLGVRMLFWVAPGWRTPVDCS
jgi:VanZ family protein